jgi:hypothetical protein
MKGGRRYASSSFDEFVCPTTMCGHDNLHRIPHFVSRIKGFLCLATATSARVGCGVGGEMPQRMLYSEVL